MANSRIEREEVDGRSPARASAPRSRIRRQSDKRDAAEHQHRRDVEAVEQQPRRATVRSRNDPVREPEQVGHVASTGRRATVRKWIQPKTSGKVIATAQQAAPEEQLVHPPAQARALADEGLRRRDAWRRRAAQRGERSRMRLRARTSSKPRSPRTAASAACSARPRSGRRRPRWRRRRRRCRSPAPGRSSRRLREPTTIAATSSAGPERGPRAGAQRSARRDGSCGGGASSGARCRGRKTRAVERPEQPAASAASSTNPGQTTPRRSRKKPSSSGGKNPPSPPMAPTRPVTVPVSRGEVLRHQLEHRAVAEAEQRGAAERADRGRRRPARPAGPRPHVVGGTPSDEAGVLSATPPIG